MLRERERALLLKKGNIKFTMKQSSIFLCLQKGREKEREREREREGEGEKESIGVERREHYDTMPQSSICLC